jgi:g-D-glutamyl-meso-diaminopimelate peptidase
MEHIIEHIDYDYNGFCEIMRSLCREYSFLRYETIGKTVFGRGIPSLRLGNVNDYVLYTAATNGSERITTTVLLGFIAQLCDALKN